jgi:hypothetical protein
VDELMSAMPQRVPGESRAARNARLREADRVLKAAGFKAGERSRLRNARPETIRAALETGDLPKRKYGIEFDLNPPKRFFNRYNLIIVVKFWNREIGEYEEVYVTLTSNHKPTKGDIKAAVADIVGRNAVNYKDRVFVGFEVEEAFENEGMKREPRSREKAGYAGKYAQGTSSDRE